MKNILFLFLVLLSIYSCQNDKYSVQSEKEVVKVDTTKSDSKTETSKTSIEGDSTERSKVIAEEIKNFQDFIEFKVYQLKDTIIGDFNGDGKNDKMFIFKIDNIKKLIFYDGLSKKQEVLGKDKSFDGIIDDLEWVDFWGTTADKETGQVIIEEDEVAGEKDAKLEYISLFFRKCEVGGGVLTYSSKGKKFVWIHQSC